MSDSKNEIKLFEEQKIRSHWDGASEEWYFSVVDVVEVLTGSVKPRVYWFAMKQRVQLEDGFELSTICRQLKLVAPDGKMRETDCANVQGLLRIIQSIPSKKAEPFKLWLAQVGRERIDEIVDPELSIDRALETYLRKGYSEDWSHQRLLAIRVRKELVDEWKDRGVKPGMEHAILTDDISRAWTDMSTREYKDYKGLTKENLRDNMTTMELVLNMLAETSATEISKVEQPETFPHNRAVAQAGGTIAGDARRAIEERTGKPVLSEKNAVTAPHAIDVPLDVDLKELGE
jgi:hypothetical protein